MHPVNDTSLESKVYENGNYRRPINMKMDGMTVFNFAIIAVSNLIPESLFDCSLCLND